MDSLTQAVYGAVLAQAGLQRRLGRKAVAWGAVAGTVPDLDVAASLVLGPLAEHSFHRGITHSLSFAVAGGAGLGWACWAWYRRKALRSGEKIPGGGPGDAPYWVALWAICLATHALLDAFTGYGTQLFLPFSDTRVALHGLAIIDPLYTVPLCLALLAGAILGYRRRAAVAVALAALCFSTGYQLWTLRWHGEATAEVAAWAAANGVRPERVFVTPIPPSSVLRRAVVLSADAVHVGHFSLLPGRDAGLWSRAPRAGDPVVDRLADTAEGRVFRWFAADMVVGRTIANGRTVEVRLDDLRYGFPGVPADVGLWGIRATFDAATLGLEGAVERFRRPYAITDANLAWLWDAVRLGFAAAGEPPD